MRCLRSSEIFFGLNRGLFKASSSTVFLQIKSENFISIFFLTSTKAQHRASFPRWNALVMDGINNSFPLIVTKCATFMPSRNARGMISEWKHDVLFFITGGLIEVSSLFLDASLYLYKRVCPSVGPTVRRSHGLSVRNAFVKRFL